MAGERLSLCWQDHHSSLVKVVESLLGNEALVDCTLAAEGKYLKAHKIILSACSPYFQLLFNQESGKNPIVILKDVKFNHLKLVVDFIYRGEIQLCHTQLEEFLAVAKSLQVKGLGAYDESSKKTGSDEPVNKRPSNQEQDEIEHNVGRIGPITIESAFTLSPDTSSDNFEPDIHPWSLPIDLPDNVPPRSPSQKTDYSAETIITGEQEIENLPEEQSVSDGNTDNEVTEVQFDQRSSGHDDSRTTKRDRTFDPIVLVKKLKVKSHQPINLSKSQMEERRGRVSREDTIKSTSSGELVSCPAQRININDSPGTSKRLPLVDGTFSQTNPDEPCTISLESSKLQPSLPTPAKIPRRSGLMKVPPKSKKRYRCPECLRPFLRSSDLVIHRRLHTRKRPYKCPHCTKCFTRASDLRSHSRVHSEVQPSTCKVCNKYFSRPSALKIHMHQHTGEKPYECQHCGEKIPANSHLSSHSPVHMEGKYTCDSCGEHFKRKMDQPSHSVVDHSIEEQKSIQEQIKT